MNEMPRNTVPKSSRVMFDVIPPKASVVAGDEAGDTEPAGECGATAKKDESKQVRSSVEAVDSLISHIISEPISHKDELEAVLNSNGDPLAELTKAGAVVPKTKEKLKVDPPAGQAGNEKLKINEEEFYQKVISQIRAPIAGGVSLIRSPKPAIKTEFIVREEKPVVDIQAGIADFYKKPGTTTVTAGKPVAEKPRTVLAVPVVEKRPLNFAPPKKNNFSTHIFVILGLVGILAYGFTLKNELVRDSSSAFLNLEQAQEDLKQLDFTSAAENFRKSYENFAQASQNLNLLSAGLAGVFADLPGAGKLRSAKNASEAGQLLTKAGQAMSEALSALAETGAILDPKDSHKVKPLKVINQLKIALILSSQNFSKAKALVAGIDETAVPEEKREGFLDFRDKIPLLEKTISEAVEYTDFLEGMIGIDEPKKYLLLFNNHSELRPTGGFPGTYGVVSFSGGGLSDFFVDDVYNLDGQLKRNIVPPKQIQHITPTWGMRDAAWFADFPSSARKSMWFFAQEAGYKVDGVIALNPDIIEEILKVVGPIEMPEYGLTLTSDNFLESIQEEVEYGENRTQPKKVVVDLAPRLLERLYSANSDKWMRIFAVFMAGLEEKDVMLYFEDKGLEEFAVKKGFGGEINKTSSDYLTVNFSNIKGSKTDIVTDSSVMMDSRISGNKIVHKVIISRRHNGGDHEHGFYNRSNPSYVRVLVPEGAELLHVIGNDLPKYKPLIDYGLAGFSKDGDLERFESSVFLDKNFNVDKYEESGKQGIGFWMVAEPGTEKKVELEYTVPFGGGNYSFYFQKQPGLDWRNFSFRMNTDGRVVTEATPALDRIGSLYMREGELKKDFEVKIKFK